MKDKKYLDNVNPERREFLEKLTKGAFIIPTVISVMMLNQKLNLTTANAQSNDGMGGCLSFDTLIATPQGNIPMIELETGDARIYSGHGRKQGNTADELVWKVSVPNSHVVFHLILNDGKKLYVSGSHPTADERIISDLIPGDIIDGAKLTSIEKVLYSGGYTYDLLPAGDTGFYWANGDLLGSTLSRNSGFFIRKVLQPEIQPFFG